jgi:DNA-binding transcriptional ArsR family regulator
MNALVATPAEPPRTAGATQGARAELMVRVLKAMAHRERLAILCLLLDGEMCVRDLEHGVGMRQAALSQQLSRLRAENIVEAVRHGRFMLYRLKTPQIQAVVRAVCREIPAA